MCGKHCSIHQSPIPNYRLPALHPQCMPHKTSLSANRIYAQRPKVPLPAHEYPTKVHKESWFHLLPKPEGGCHPASTQIARERARNSLFNDKAAIVARPTAVLPIIMTAVSSQVKCSSHNCVRGLNRGTTCPVSASKNSTSVPFASLHKRQDNHRFSSSSVPPRAMGLMCSTVRGIPLTTSWV